MVTIQHGSERITPANVCLLLLQVVVQKDWGTSGLSTLPTLLPAIWVLITNGAVFGCVCAAALAQRPK
jgi:hypothetical protein